MVKKNVSEDTYRNEVLSNYEQSFKTGDVTIYDLLHTCDVLTPIFNIQHMFEFILLKHEELTEPELLIFLQILKYESRHNDAFTNNQKNQVNMILDIIMTHPNAGDEIKAQYRRDLSIMNGTYNINTQAEYMIDSSRLTPYFIEAVEHPSTSFNMVIASAVTSLILNENVENSCLQLILQAAKKAALQAGKHRASFIIHQTKMLQTMRQKMEERNWRAKTQEQIQLAALIQTAYDIEIFTGPLLETLFEEGLAKTYIDEMFKAHLEESKKYVNLKVKDLNLQEGPLA